MAQKMKQIHYDVVVIGGGSAGIAAAISSARNGAKTLLLECGPMIGGELLSGIPIDGCLSSRGEWVVGGVAAELFEECKRMDGYIGAFSDRRALWVVTVDPEVMNVAIIRTLSRSGVTTLLYSFAEDVVVEDGVLKGVVVVNKSGRTLISADMFIDCGGDGDVAALAGAPFEMGGAQGEMQPVSMVFRMANVDSEALLAFVRDEPEHFGLAENPLITKSVEECAQELYEQGLPKVFIKGTGPLFREAIERGEMYPSSLLAITPVSIPRKEVSINSTRVSGIDATKTEDLSNALSLLLDQVEMCVQFLKKRVPGFEQSVFSGLAPRIGIRETRRIMGDYVLQTEDVIGMRKFADGIAKGAHHLDVHGSGTSQQLVELSGSYDIPYGCLVPRNLENVLIAGRCLSATREAHGSARVMGTCMAMGQAAGLAAAMCVTGGYRTRDVPVQELRRLLKDQGAILDGTY